MRTFFEGTWAGQEVVLVLSRVGKVSASITTLLLLERFGVTHIVFTGVAGAIDPSLRIGDVAAPPGGLVNTIWTPVRCRPFSDLRFLCLGRSSLKPAFATRPPSPPSATRKEIS